MHTVMLDFVSPDRLNMASNFLTRSALADQHSSLPFPEIFWRLVCSIDLLEEVKDTKLVSTRLHGYTDDTEDV